MTKEQVIHPAHYNIDGVPMECKEVVQYMNFYLGSAVKYVWRAGLKSNEVEDLEKAVNYINFEINLIYRLSVISQHKIPRHVKDHLNAMCDRWMSTCYTGFSHHRAQALRILLNPGVNQTRKALLMARTELELELTNLKEKQK